MATPITITRNQKLGMGGGAAAIGAVGATGMLLDQGQQTAPTTSGDSSYGRTFGGGMPSGDPSYGRTFGATETPGNPGYGRTFGADTYAGAPVAAPADTYYVPAPAGSGTYGDTYAPASYAPAPGYYAPASSPVPAMPLPPPPPPRSAWSMKIGERLGAFNPAQGARSLRLPQNLPGPNPRALPPMPRPAAPVVPSFMQPGQRPVLPPMPNLPRR